MVVGMRKVEKPLPSFEFKTVLSVPRKPDSAAEKADSRSNRV